MKHAIMVIGSGSDSVVLQKTINHFDDDEIDFFIHWDQDDKAPVLHSKYSKIVFIKRRKVNWGGSSLVYTERDLMSNVFHFNREYDYVHLISSSDIPLMTKEYFKDYFKDDLYLGFVPKDIVLRDIKRLEYYWPTDYINGKEKFGKIILKVSEILNKVLRINRLSNRSIKIGKGCEWFSIKYKFLNEILKYNHMDIFKYTYAADEMYLQTVLNNYKIISHKGINDCQMAARYIDWNRGRPYVFGLSDVPELRKLVNTNYAFARKVYDANVMKKIFV